jgi:hypothetical protein
MSMLFTNDRVTHLRFAVIFEWIRYSDQITGQYEGCFRKAPKLFRHIKITQVNDYVDYVRLRQVSIGNVCAGT